MLITSRESFADQMQSMRGHLDRLREMPLGSNTKAEQLSRWLTSANAYARDAVRMHEAVAALKPQGVFARVFAGIRGIWDSAEGEEKFTKSDIRQMAAATKRHADRVLTTISRGLKKAEPALAPFLAEGANFDVLSWEHNVRQTHSFLEEAVGRIEKIVGRKAGFALAVGAFAVGAAYLADGSSRAEANELTENLGHQPVTAGTTPPRPETAQGVIDYYRKGPGDKVPPIGVTV